MASVLKDQILYIPSEIANVLGISPEDEFKIKVKNGKIVLTPKRRKQ